MEDSSYGTSSISSQSTDPWSNTSNSATSRGAEERDASVENASSFSEHHPHFWFWSLSAFAEHKSFLLAENTPDAQCAQCQLEITGIQTSKQATSLLSPSAHTEHEYSSKISWTLTFAVKLYSPILHFTKTPVALISWLTTRSPKKYGATNIKLLERWLFKPAGH